MSDIRIAGQLVNDLEAELVRIFNLEKAEDDSGWFWPSDQEPQGPYEFVECIEKYHEMLDRTYLAMETRAEKAEAELTRLTALLEDRYEMADEILAFFRVERDQTLEKPVNKFVALALADRIRGYLKGQP